jgi:hypothetical protein
MDNKVSTLTCIYLDWVGYCDGHLMPLSTNSIFQFILSWSAKLVEVIMSILDKNHWFATVPNNVCFVYIQCNINCKLFIIVIQNIWRLFQVKKKICQSLVDPCHIHKIFTANPNFFFNWHTKAGFKLTT